MTGELFNEADVLSADTLDQLERQLREEIARSIRNEPDPVKRRTRMTYAIDFFSGQHRGFDAQAFKLQCGGVVRSQ